MVFQSLGRDAVFVRLRQRADVTGRVLEAVRGSWLQAVGCASPAVLKPRSRPAEPRPSARLGPCRRDHEAVVPALDWGSWPGTPG